MNIIMQRIDLAGENPALSADVVPQEDGTVEALWTVEVKRSQIAVDLTDWEVCAYVKTADGELATRPCGARLSRPLAGIEGARPSTFIEPIRGRVRGDRITVPLTGLPAVPMTLALKIEKDGQKRTLAVLKLSPLPRKHWKLEKRGEDDGGL